MDRRITYKQKLLEQLVRVKWFGHRLRYDLVNNSVCLNCNRHWPKPQTTLTLRRNRYWVCPWCLNAKHIRVYFDGTLVVWDSESNRIPSGAEVVFYVARIYGR